MTTIFHVRSGSHRPWRPALGVVLAALLAVIASGCSEKTTDPTFQEPPPPAQRYWFLGLWGGASNDVYAVGQPGLIAHFNGTSWNWEDSGTSAPLTDIYSPDGGTTYYVCGHDGVILRKSGGGGWSRMTSGTSADLFGLGAYEGQVYVTGRAGELRRLSGGSWVDSGTDIIVRDANGGEIDTLDRREDISNLTAVTDKGIGGLRGVILMEDDDWDWQRRLVQGGQDEIYAGFGNANRLDGNFLGTKDGRLYQLVLRQGENAWEEQVSPSLSFASIGGLWSLVSSPEIVDCFVVNWAGEVIQETFETLPGDEGTLVTVNQLLNIAEELQDVWGAALDDLFVCGKSLNLWRYHDPLGGGSPSWEQFELSLPAKVLAGSMPPAVDKFGRVH